jgi:hypothetical protein
LTIRILSRRKGEIKRANQSFDFRPRRASVRLLEAVPFVHDAADDRAAAGVLITRRSRNSFHVAWVQKALKENPRCETIYLASVFTEAVQNQIRDDGQVRRTFNLIDVLDNSRQKKAFLDEIFKFIIRLDY